MKIEITQDDRGFDVVTIDGVVASTDVAAIILDAVDCIETCQYNEANASWGPEDGGSCPCGGVTCDGTCEPPF